MSSFLKPSSHCVRLRRHTIFAQFIGLCSGVRPCSRRSISLVVSAPLPRPLAVLRQAAPRACPPAVPESNWPTLSPGLALARAPMALAPGPPRRRRPGGPVPRPAGRPTLLGARRPAPRQRPHRAPAAPAHAVAGLRAARPLPAGPGGGGAAPGPGVRRPSASALALGGV